jgi:ribonuclease BN (tRNA processing enzyme)
MEPNIVFLGTGGDAVVVGKQVRASGGIVLQLNDLQLWIDPGPGALVRGLQYDVNVRETTAVCVTHAHTNHVNDMNALLGAMTYNGMDIKGVLVANETVVNGSEAAQPVLTKFHRNLVERVIVAKPEQKIGVEDIEIHALKAKHTDEHAIGFKFFTHEFVLSYSGDTAYSGEIAEQFRKSDIIILNTVYPADTKSDEHLTVEDVVRIVKTAEPKLTVITHFGSKMLQYDPIQAARDIQRETKHQVIAAKDGLTLNPLSYSANMKQKTLNLY